MRSASRFYTRDDFDVFFSARVPAGEVRHYLGKRLVLTTRIGQPCSNEGWDRIVFSTADRWVCPETPQDRRRAAALRDRKRRAANADA